MLCFFFQMEFVHINVLSALLCYVNMLGGRNESQMIPVKSN